MDERKLSMSLDVPVIVRDELEGTEGRAQFLIGGQVIGYAMPVRCQETGKLLGVQLSTNDKFYRDVETATQYVMRLAAQNILKLLAQATQEGLRNGDSSSDSVPF